MGRGARVRGRSGRWAHERWRVRRHRRQFAWRRHNEQWAGCSPAEQHMLSMQYLSGRRCEINALRAATGEAIEEGACLAETGGRQTCHDVD